MASAGAGCKMCGLIQIRVRITRYKGNSLNSVRLRILFFQIALRYPEDGIGFRKELGKGGWSLRV